MQQYHVVGCCVLAYEKLALTGCRTLQNHGKSNSTVWAINISLLIYPWSLHRYDQLSVVVRQSLRRRVQVQASPVCDIVNSPVGWSSSSFCIVDRQTLQHVAIVACALLAAIVSLSVFIFYTPERGGNNVCSCPVLVLLIIFVSLSFPFSFAKMSLIFCCYFSQTATDHL